MTIRDLGYRAYDGPRNPPSHNAWVMLRQGLLRAWGSWMVKVAVFLCWIPPLIAAAVVAVVRYFSREMTGDPEAEDIQAFFGSQVLRWLFFFQTYGFVSLVSAGAGASAIAEDFTFKAFQFYLAKPVTVAHYLAGRVLAVSFFVFLVTFPPSILVGLALAGTAPPDHLVDDVLLLVPSLVHSLLLSVIVASTAVAISSLSKSRALTTSAWVFVFLVPAGVAFVVDTLADWPWLYLVSITGLLGIVADALFKAQTESPLTWYHALPVLVLLLVGSGALALHRLRRAEVFG